MDSTFHLSRLPTLLLFGVFCLIASPQTHAASASQIVVDNQTGYIFTSRNAEQRHQVASLTKIAMAVVVLDAAELKMVSLGDSVSVPQIALSSGGANPAGLQAGDVLSLRDLLYCALLSSDNISASAIAHHMGSRLPNRTRLDPIGNFVAHMNSLARNLKMKRTLFLNPHGLDNLEGTLPFSTAADIARLTRYALSDGDFRFFVSQKSRDVDLLRQGESISVRLQNTNQLLGQDGIDGVKTGMTNNAGFCLVLSSWRNPEVVRHQDGVTQTPRRIIAVLLGSPNSDARFSEGLKLIRGGWGLYDRWAANGRKVTRKDTL